VPVECGTHHLADALAAAGDEDDLAGAAEEIRDLEGLHGSMRARNVGGGGEVPVKGIQVQVGSWMQCGELAGSRSSHMPVFQTRGPMPFRPRRLACGMLMCNRLGSYLLKSCHQRPGLSSLSCLKAIYQAAITRRVCRALTRPLRGRYALWTRLFSWIRFQLRLCPKHLDCGAWQAYQP
jgi:hypothetical protein